MVQINYNCYILKKIIKTSSDNIIIEDSITLLCVLDMLNKKYGERFKKSLIDSKSGRLKLLILINGISITDLDYKINNSDELNIISMPMGG